MLPLDPEMLYSYVNLKLRDEYSSLEEMCEKLDEDRTELEERLQKAGYRYEKETNRLVAVRRPGGIV